MVTNRLLVELLRQNVDEKSIKSYVGKDAEKLVNEVINNELSTISFMKAFKKKWRVSSRCYNSFLDQHTGWLQKDVVSGVASVQPIGGNGDVGPQDLATNSKRPVQATKKKGRKKVDAQSASKSTKLRRISSLVKENCLEILLKATIRKLDFNGRQQDAEIIKKMLKPNKTANFYSATEALALLQENGLSKDNYQNLRSGAIDKGLKTLYPAYNSVREEKQKCLPAEIKVTDFTASIDLQNLMDHTVTRILHGLEDKSWKDSKKTFILESKGGVDGTTGQSLYKQYTAEDTLPDETAILYTAVVPLKLYVKETGDVIWQNLKPSSTHYCRPLRIQFARETKEQTKKEVDILKKELLPTLVDNIAIDHKLSVTMIDGKVHTALSDKTNSNASCSMCGVKPNEMNNFNTCQTAAAVLEEEDFSMGISTLHLWIRSMEFILNIAYRYDTKTYQMRGDVLKEKKKVQKLRIQKELRKLNYIKTRMTTFIR